MPTLARRHDGCYIVLTCRDDKFSTWQIVARGIEFLQRRGIHGSTEGDRFSDELFSQLKAHHWVYTGERPWPEPASIGPGMPPDLLAEVRQFYTALRTEASAAARQLMLEPTEIEFTASPQVQSWQPRDYEHVGHLHDISGRPQDIARVTVDIVVCDVGGMRSTVEDLKF